MTLSTSFASKILLALLATFQINAGLVLHVDAREKTELDKHLDESYRLTKAGEDEEALAEAEKGVKIDAGPSILKRKAECLFNLGRGKEALVEARKAVKLSPRDAELHMLLGTICSDLKMDAEATSELSEAISERSADRGFRLARAKLYLRRHEYSKAADDLSVAIVNTELKNRGKPLEQRGNCYLILKDYPRAIADFSAAIVCSDGRSSLLRQRAEAYEKLGNHVAAQKDLKAAGSMDEAFEPPTTLGGNK